MATGKEENGNLLLFFFRNMSHMVWLIRSVGCCLRQDTGKIQMVTCKSGTVRLELRPHGKKRRKRRAIEKSRL